MSVCERCTENGNCAWQNHDETICRENPAFPITNADRIRAMSDEELAKQLAGEQYVGMKTFILGLDRELLPAIEEETRKAWPEIVKEKLDWLREEVTNE